ncbi:hypothetical protein BV25DRAFT_363404 [Artomyces pyxidatus]|uniref:Uncharacterized protein n=1 Tax=Artomyces pyxidatus TaxID=48021 RepID=A0ACB8T503_9AGAM|nr:hypothetical protein BV25DRAFT_363404 [Artomyces pyxidatus]
MRRYRQRGDASKFRMERDHHHGGGCNHCQPTQHVASTLFQTAIKCICKAVTCASDLQNGQRRAIEKWVYPRSYICSFRLDTYPRRSLNSNVIRMRAVYAIQSPNSYSGIQKPTRVKQLICALHLSALNEARRLSPSARNSTWKSSRSLALAVAYEKGVISDPSARVRLKKSLYNS